MNFEPDHYIMAGLFGLFFWAFKRWHGQAIDKMDEIVKANHKTSLLVERHDAEIDHNRDAVRAAHKRLDALCNTPSS